MMPRNIQPAINLIKRGEGIADGDPRTTSLMHGALAAENLMLSNHAYMKSVARRLAMRTVKNNRTGCIEWMNGATAKGGYGRLAVNRGRWVRAHRAAWVLLHGAIPLGMCVCHTCDNPRCCNVDHLFLGTPADNNRDMMRKLRGKSPPVHYGERHHNTTLTAAQVLTIKTEKHTLDRLAQKYGVSAKTIWRIKKGLTWNCVAGRAT